MGISYGAVGTEEFTDIKVRLAGSVRQLAKEFEGIFHREHVAAIVEECAEKLKDATLASFVPVLAHRFARERLRSQAQSEGKIGKTVPNVVFVSTSGGGRARMAASLLEQRAGTRLSVHSAGSGSIAAIDDTVRAAMEEIGISLSDKYARPLAPEVLASADIVVTMGGSVGELDIPASARHVNWRVGDPANADLDEVRRIRDDVAERVEELARELLPAEAVAPAG